MKTTCVKMEMSWITAIKQLYSQIINLFGNAILKHIHIRLFDLLTSCHYILNPPRKFILCYLEKLFYVIFCVVWSVVYFTQKTIEVY